MNFAIGGVFAAVIGFAAWRAHALTKGGALAAFFVGTATFGALGWPGAAVLLAFFISSTALSRFGKTRKKTLVDIDKQGARDEKQVLANGGIAAVCALLALIDPAHHWQAAFAGAFAAATADTWGTEIGTLASQQPRSIISGKPIATGFSGGITVVGTLAEVIGAFFIAGIATLIDIHALLAIAVGGIAGAFIDSFLGATLQSLHWCPTCLRACETTTHVCGTATTLQRGLALMNNDAVNFAATISGAAIAFFLNR